VIAFLVDQNVNEHIVDGLTRRDATLEFPHVRDVGLAAAPGGSGVRNEWYGLSEQGEASQQLASRNTPRQRNPVPVASPNVSAVPCITRPGSPPGAIAATA